MATMRSGKGDKTQKNAAVVSMVAPKAEIVEKIIEKVIEVEKIVEIAAPDRSVASNTIRLEDIQMEQVAGFNDAMIQVRQDCRQDMAAIASKLKQDMASDKAQLDAKMEESNDMAESMAAEMTEDKKTAEAAMLVLNSQLGQLGKELEKQIKVSIGLGILLLTSIVLAISI